MPSPYADVPQVAQPYAREVADVSNELWEEHADWWIDGFTEGADPEYVEQILPLAASELAGADGCSTSVVATDRSAGWLRRRGAG